MSKNKHIGSNFDDWLKEEGFMTEKGEMTGQKHGSISITLPKSASYEEFFKVLLEAGYDIEIFVIPPESQAIEEVCDIPTSDPSHPST